MSNFVTVFEIARLSNGVWWDTVFRLVAGIVALGTGSAGIVVATKGDVILVGGVSFEVNYFLVTPAYRDTIAHGGR